MRYALEITSVHRIRPTPEGRTRALRTCLLRRRYPAPNDGVEVKDLRPLTRSALAGRSLTPTPQPALPKSGGGFAAQGGDAVLDGFAHLPVFPRGDFPLVPHVFQLGQFLLVGADRRLIRRRQRSR